MGILTVGVVTKPFHFEGAHRMRTAEAGIEELSSIVDTLIIIPNQNLFRVATERTTFADAFKMADDVLHSGVRGVTDLMVMPGLINLDFADIRTVMSEMGKAMMGTGEAEGDKRAIEAAEAAISNPLLDDTSMKGAKGVLINITGGLDMTLFEVDEAANRIRDEVDSDANIIFGSTFDEKLNGKMRVSVVATGIASEAAQQQPPKVVKLDVVASTPLPRPQAATPQPQAAPRPLAPQSVFRPAVAVPSAPTVSRAPSAPAVARTLPAERHDQDDLDLDLGPSPRIEPTPHSEHAAPRREPVFDLPDAPRGHSMTSMTQAVREISEASMAAPAPQPAADYEPPKRTGSLFGRLVGRTAAAPAARDLTPAPAPAPTPQPQSRSLESRRETTSAHQGTHQSDDLDIPAFLRRQAN